MSNKCDLPALNVAEENLIQSPEVIFHFTFKSASGGSRSARLLDRYVEEVYMQLLYWSVAFVFSILREMHSPSRARSPPSSSSLIHTQVCGSVPQTELSPAPVLCHPTLTPPCAPFI